MAIDRLDPEAVFHAARHLPADRRAAYLDGACAADPAVRRRVERLLAAEPEVGSFLEAPAPELDAARAAPGATEQPGTVIGPYKLLEQIGEGAFGVVFLAEQTQPVRRKVALKVLKAGMDTKQVVARFEAERQALALMDHPNIAKVFDGGTTNGGRPYFVMELVRGLPITEYCDQHRLTPRARLSPFQSLCSAVQHAHQKGVIHRDLKPSNVLVSMHDATPVVKVIDFGIAKALGQELTDRTFFTGFAQLVGTPAYMSPEQAGLSGLDVDTRSDVYSLGVLLYELLIGSTPFDKDRLRAAGYDELRRIIREEEPARPSARLSTLGPVAETVSTNRGSEPKRLTALVRGELDWIVMKCLEKDRNRRYETANALAADVQRYLAHEPVLACPPSRWYRLRKFGQRNKLSLTVGALVVAVLLVATAVSTGLAIWAQRSKSLAESRLEMEQRQRERARAALEAMYSSLVQEWLVKQPELSPEHKQFLEYALSRYEEFAADDRQNPEARAGAAHAYHRVGQIRDSLGDHDGAAAALERARALLAGLVAEFPAEPRLRQGLAHTHLDLGAAHAGSTRHAEAVESFQGALAISQQLAAEYPEVADHRRNVGRAYGRLGNSHFLLGDPAAAIAATEQGLATLREVSEAPGARPQDHASLAHLHDGLGLQYRKIGRLRMAEDSHGQAVRILQKLSQEHPKDRHYRDDLARSHNYLSLMYRETGRVRDAKAASAKAIAIGKQLAAEFPSVPSHRLLLAGSHADLGVILYENGELPEAEHEYRQALALQRQLADDFPTTPEHRRELAKTLNGLGLLLKKAERLKEAEETYVEAVAHRRRLVDENPTVPLRRRDLAVTLNNLATLVRDLGRPEEAKAHYQEAVALHKQLTVAYPGVSDHQNETAGALVNLARLLRTLQQPEEARRLLDEALPYHRAALGANPRNPVYRNFYRINRWRLAETFLDLGDHTAAAAATAEFLGLATEPARDAYTAAGLLATCARLALEDTRLGAAQRADVANAYRDRGLAALQQSIERGFKDAALIKTDQTLDPLRAREDFQRLLRQLEAGKQE